jgi:hypothetical protein
LVSQKATSRETLAAIPKPRVKNMILMEGNLNDLEISLLETFVFSFPFFKTHISKLNVVEREATGVGMFIRFTYLDSNGIDLDNRYLNTGLATDHNIQLNNLEFGLAYEVGITNSKIDFIELVTYGEDWDGTYDTFKIEKLNFNKS